MARVRRMTKIQLGEHLASINASLVEKFRFDYLPESICKFNATCRKCDAWYGFHYLNSNMELSSYLENRLKQHYYQNHKTRRNTNRQEINNVALMHSYEIAKGSEIAKKEKNDCVVRAFAAVFEMSYDESHALLKRHGRKDRSGTPWITSDTAMAEIVSKGSFKAIRRNDLEANKWTNNYRRTGMTLNGLIPRLNPSRRYLICSRAHMFAYVSGRLVDWKKGGKRTIVRVWEIEKFP